MKYPKITKNTVGAKYIAGACKYLVSDPGTSRTLWNEGDALLKEINPTMVNKMSKENITENIRRIIDKYYSFYGYTQFSNMVGSIVNYGGILKNNVLQFLGFLKIFYLLFQRYYL